MTYIMQIHVRNSQYYNFFQNEIYSWGDGVILSLFVFLFLSLYLCLSTVAQWQEVVPPYPLIYLLDMMNWCKFENPWKAETHFYFMTHHFEMDNDTSTVTKLVSQSCKLVLIP